jgi:hypothetical protein
MKMHKELQRNFKRKLMTVDREVVKDMGETNKVFDKNNIALDKFEEERERELRRVR